MQSVVRAKTQKFHFAKNMQVWTSDFISDLKTFKCFQEKNPAQYLRDRFTFF